MELHLVNMLYCLHFHQVSNWNTGASFWMLVKLGFKLKLASTKHVDAYENK